jgi:hypothetical protein
VSSINALGHLDEPIDDRSFATEPQMVPATHRQRHHPEIGLWSEAAVQPNFLAAIPLPSLKGAEVEKIETYRFLELVGVSIRQEDPGHMGLQGLDPTVRTGVAVRPHQHRDLFRQAWARLPTAHWLLRHTLPLSNRTSSGDFDKGSF